MTSKMSDLKRELVRQSEAEEGKPGTMLPPQVVSAVAKGEVEIDVSPHTNFATGTDDVVKKLIGYCLPVC